MASAGLEGGPCSLPSLCPSSTIQAGRKRSRAEDACTKSERDCGFHRYPGREEVSIHRTENWGERRRDGVKKGKETHSGSEGECPSAKKCPMLSSVMCCSVTLNVSECLLPRTIHVKEAQMTELGGAQHRPPIKYAAETGNMEGVAGEAWKPAQDTGFSTIYGWGLYWSE